MEEADLISVLGEEGEVTFMFSLIHLDVQHQAFLVREPILKARLPWFNAQDCSGLSTTNGILRDEEDTEGRHSLLRAHVGPSGPLLVRRARCH